MLLRLLRFSTAYVVKEVGDDVSKCQCLLSYWVNSAARKVLNCADLPLFKVVLHGRRMKEPIFLKLSQKEGTSCIRCSLAQKKFVVKVTSNPTQNIDEMYQKHRQ